VTAWVAAPTCEYATSLSAAYLDSFDPGDVRANWLADQGNSSSAHTVLPYSFSVPAGRTFVVTVAGTDTGPCTAYQLSVDGANIAVAPPPSPPAPPSPPGPAPSGSPPPDGDGDGIPDSADACPVVAGTTADGCPAAVPDTTSPLLSALSLSRTRFRAASSGPSIATATGATVSYTLSEAAVVKFRIERALPGRRVRGHCVKPSRSNRAAKRCTRYEALKGSITHTGSANSNRFVLKGRVGGRSLNPGSYRLVGVATDPAGNTSTPKRSGFRIVRR